MRRNHAIVLILILVLVLALLGGCRGGNDDRTDARGTTSTTTTATVGGSTTSATPAGTDPGRTAQAQAAVFQPGDFPPGYRAMPPEDGGGLSIERLWDELTRCLGLTSLPTPAGIAVSPTFIQGLATQARSTVEYTTPAAADAVAAALTGPRFDACATQAFKADVERSKPEGSTAGEAAVASREYAPVGPRTFAWRIDATVFLSDLQVPLDQDFIVVIDGGTIVRLWFLNPGSEFPPQLQRTLVETVVRRA